MKRHVLITGVGRSGTTFLIELLADLGFNTGHNLTYYKKARAGLECSIKGIGEKELPYIIKNPWFCCHAEKILKKGNVMFDHVFIPMRNLYAAAESRRYVEHKHGKFGKHTPGGVWRTKDETKQEEILSQLLYKLILALSKRMIPVTLLHFPRLTQDSKYLYKKLEPLRRKRKIDYKTFQNSFSKVVRPDLIHYFGEEE